MNQLLEFSEITMLALVVFREARGEGIDGQVGVAYSVLNRVEKPKWWGRNLLEVIGKKWQYSSLTDPNDKQLTVWPKNDHVWNQCLQIAYNCYYKIGFANPVPGADSYFDISIPSPKWATPEMFVTQIGRLKFYNVDGDYEK